MERCTTVYILLIYIFNIFFYIRLSGISIEDDNYESRLERLRDGLNDLKKIDSPRLKVSKDIIDQFKTSKSDGLTGTKSSMSQMTRRFSSLSLISSVAITHSIERIKPIAASPEDTNHAQPDPEPSTTTLKFLYELDSYHYSGNSHIQLHPFEQHFKVTESSESGIVIERINPFDDAWNVVMVRKLQSSIDSRVELKLVSPDDEIRFRHLGYSYLPNDIDVS